jgi:circadian clock protein KaiC
MTNKKTKSSKNKNHTIERVLSGIAGLDKMADGGFPKNSTIMVRGGTGTCKTNMCLQYLHEGITKYNEPGVLISFAETKEQIHKHAKSFGWDFESLEKKGLFTIIKYAPHEVLKVMEEGGGSIRDTIEAVKAKRIVIDSITAYEMLFEKRYIANESILNLFEMLRGWDATTLVTSESPVEPNARYKGHSGFLSDGVVHMYYLRNGQRRVRALEIIKMRETAHTDRVMTFTLTTCGLVVGGELKNASKY